MRWITFRTPKRCEMKRKTPTNAATAKMKVQANANPKWYEKGLSKRRKIKRYMLRTFAVCLPSFRKWNICVLVQFQFSFSSISIQFPFSFDSVSKQQHIRCDEHLYAFCKHIGNSASPVFKTRNDCNKQWIFHVVHLNRHSFCVHSRAKIMISCA